MNVPADIIVKVPMYQSGGDPDVFYEIPAGTHHFDGRTALHYVRARNYRAEMASAGTDYARMQRQRCLLGSMARQADVSTLLTAFPSLVPVIKENVSTDIPLEKLPDLVRLGTRIDMRNIVAEGFTPPEYAAAYTEEEEYPKPIPNVALIQAVVADTFTGSLPPRNLETVDQSCGEWPR